jgi:hypothetical protein
VTPDEFNAAFDSFYSSALRLECLQTYAVSAEDARLRAFREGLPRPERSVRTSPWLARIAATTLAEKSWHRLRLIRHPLTEYTRYELIGFAESQACGEQIRIIDLNEHPELGDLGPDFWLFDSALPVEFAIVIHYDADGAVLGYERTTDTGWCRDQATKAFVASISLAEFLARPR